MVELCDRIERKIIGETLLTFVHRFVFAYFVRRARDVQQPVHYKGTRNHLRRSLNEITDIVHEVDHTFSIFLKLEIS